MRNRAGATLLMVVALMALAIVAFDVPTGSRRTHAQQAHAATGIFRRDGRALIDINRADYALLLELPGIGETIAKRIVSWREQEGFFHSVDSLTEVEGIAEGKLAAILPYVTACP